MGQVSSRAPGTDSRWGETCGLSRSDECEERQAWERAGECDYPPQHRDIQLGAGLYAVAFYERPVSTIYLFIQSRMGVIDVRYVHIPDVISARLGVHVIMMSFPHLGASGWDN